MLPIVERAAKEVGGVVKLASLLGIKHPSFHAWSRVPAERVLDLERFTKIPRHEFRPDLYPPPDAPQQDVPSAESSSEAA